jgi:ABC-type nitrate/sulfonate/bicarbonate transport system substrate-binding protein
MPQPFASLTTRRTFVTTAAAWAGAYASTSGAAGAQTVVPLRANIFGGLDAWPIYVLRERGFFARDGYTLALTATAGSVTQFQHVQAGDADIAATALDNVVAYDDGQGDPSVTAADFAAFLGIGSGFLTLVTRPDVTSYAQLRGKAFAVDAPGTGFSFVLRRMLEKNGIMPGDYSFVALGSTQKRFEGIASGQCVGGMVGAPFDVLGRERYGLHVLGSALEVLGHYQASVMMARRSWIAANGPAIVAFVRAYRAATAWMFDPANRDDAVAILARNTDLPPELLARIGPPILANPASFSRSGAFDPAGVATTLELRTAYAVPRRSIVDPARFIETAYL